MLKKIVFMGTPIFAVPILKSLYVNGYEVSIVYTQPPQKSKKLRVFKGRSSKGIRGINL